MPEISFSAWPALTVMFTAFSTVLGLLSTSGTGQSSLAVLKLTLSLTSEAQPDFLLST